MTNDFDPYFKWLGIPPSEQPPNHYRLLGLPPFVDDLDVIESAADQRMAHIRNLQSGKDSQASQKILDELSSAAISLLNPSSKKAYDADLHARLTTANKTGFAIQYESDLLPYDYQSGPGIGYPQQTTFAAPLSMKPVVAWLAAKPQWLLNAAIAGGSILILLVIVAALILSGKSPPEISHEPTKDSPVETAPVETPPAVTTLPPRATSPENLPRDSNPPTSSDQIDSGPVNLGLVGRVRTLGQDVDVLLNYKSSGILLPHLIGWKVKKRIPQFLQGMEVEFQGFILLEKAQQISIRLRWSSTPASGGTVLVIDGRDVGQISDVNPIDVTVDLNLTEGRHSIAWHLNGTFGDCVLEFFDEQGDLLPLLHDAGVIAQISASATEEFILGEREDVDAQRRAVDWTLQMNGRVNIQRMTTRGRQSMNPSDYGDLSRELCIVSAVYFPIVDNFKVDDAGLANLKGLFNLDTLRLRNSRITDAGLSNLSNMHHLRSLVLSDTQGITDEGIKELGRLSSLEHLELANTKITESGLRQLLQLVDLQSLDISGMQFGIREAECIARLPSLRTLQLKSVSTFSDASLEIIAELRSLENLSLSESNVTDDHLAIVARITSLKNLELIRTSISDKGLESIKDLPYLKRIHLNLVQGITDEGLRHLANRSGLQYLSLSGVRSITDSGLSHIGTMRDLQTLTLDDNSNITDAGLGRLKELTELDYLSLTSDAVTAEGITAFKQLHPKCRVYYKRKPQ